MFCLNVLFATLHCSPAVMWLQERTHKKFLSKCLVYLSAFIKVPTEILPPRAKPEIHANSTPGFRLTANLFQQRGIKRYFFLIFIDDVTLH